MDETAGKLGMLGSVPRPVGKWAAATLHSEYGVGFVCLSNSDLSESEITFICVCVQWVLWYGGTSQRTTLQKLVLCFCQVGLKD